MAESHALRAALTSTVLIPVAVVLSFVATDRLTAAPEAITDAWPWFAALAVLVLATCFGGRWAGIHDWGFVPFILVSTLLVRWWGAALALYLIMLGPVSIATAAGFWVMVCAIALLGSLLQ